MLVLERTHKPGQIQDRHLLRVALGGGLFQSHLSYLLIGKYGYAFIKAQEQAHSVRMLCRMMVVHPSGYYAWRSERRSARAVEDQRLLGRIKQSWLESGGVYGYRKVHDDMRELGERCGHNRVARLMRAEGLRSQRGYGRRPKVFGTQPSVIAPNHLARAFEVAEPNKVWVTDITYIRTHEGWLYLAVVLDLFSRQVVGWSMQPRIDRELAIGALLMAVWRRRPSGEVLVHSDQGSQFSSYDWQDFLKEHHLKASMSRRGNCHDNAVAESASSSCSSASASVAGPTRTGRQRGATCSTTSKCSTTPNVAMETTTGCRRSSSKGGISTRSRVSRRPGSIHSAKADGALHRSGGRVMLLKVPSSVTGAPNSACACDRPTASARIQ